VKAHQSENSETSRKWSARLRNHSRKLGPFLSNRKWLVQLKIVSILKQTSSTMLFLKRSWFNAKFAKRYSDFVTPTSNVKECKVISGTGYYWKPAKKLTGGIKNNEM
jgi:hypothetical protein